MILSHNHIMRVLFINLEEKIQMAEMTTCLDPVVMVSPLKMEDILLKPQVYFLSGLL